VLEVSIPLLPPVPDGRRQIIGDWGRLTVRGASRLDEELPPESVRDGIISNCRRHNYAEPKNVHRDREEIT
jgi:hypothetical protein